VMNSFNMAARSPTPSISRRHPPTCGCGLRRSGAAGAGFSPTPGSRSCWAPASTTSITSTWPSSASRRESWIWLTPPRYLGKPGQFWTVKTVDPMRALVLEQRPPLPHHRNVDTRTATTRQMERKMLKTIAKRSVPPASQLSTFRSAEGKRLYLDAYQKALGQWPVPFQDLMVPTAFGDTHVIVSGEPAAAPVVLLHATGTSATGWLKNVGPLSQHHRVFAVDIMGEAGRSRQHALLRDRHDCATWVASLLDQLGLEQASFVGWSFGGWATLAFLMAEPDRVSKCVLLAPYASLAPYKLPVLLFLKLAPYLPTGPPGRLALRMMAPGFRFDERFAEQFILGGRYFKAADPKASVFPQPYSDEELRSISTPVLLLVGDEETTFKPQLAVNRARRHIPHIETDVLPGIGHLIAMEAAEEVNQRILRFLE
jgi:pimeloyl-ACP methyl ester carboxylesterase